MISCLGAPTHLIFMPRDPFQLSSVVMSQYSKKNFLEKGSGRSPESFPESLPIWVNKTQLRKETLYGPESYPTLNNKISLDFISLNTNHRIQMKTEVCYQSGLQKFMVEQN